MWIYIYICIILGLTLFKLVISCYIWRTHIYNIYIYDLWIVYRNIIYIPMVLIVWWFSQCQMPEGLSKMINPIMNHHQYYHTCVVKIIPNVNIPNGNGLWHWVYHIVIPHIGNLVYDFNMFDGCWWFHDGYMSIVRLLCQKITGWPDIAGTGSCWFPWSWPFVPPWKLCTTPGPGPLQQLGRIKSTSSGNATSCCTAARRIAPFDVGTWRMGTLEPRNRLEMGSNVLRYVKGV